MRHLQLFVPITVIAALTAAVVAVVVAAVVALSVSIGGATGASAATRCSSDNVSTMNIVAHQDDDLLFQSPALLHNVQHGQCVRTVYLTAGDSGDPAWYWMGREAGVEAAYAQMAGVSNNWTTSDAAISGHPVHLRVLTGKPTISLVYLRLPDGNMNGSGFAATGHESLQKLYTGSIATIHAVDGSTSYSLAALRTTLLGLMNIFKPNQINTLDYVGGYGDGDHSDHHTVGYLVQATQLLFQMPHGLAGYQGYDETAKASNVVSRDATVKAEVFYTYATYDWQTCDSEAKCAAHPESLWIPRQYIVGASTWPPKAPPVRPAAGANFALSATATASSQNMATGQTASKAIDGVIDGYPGDSTKEWATIDGKEGSFLNLAWPSAVSLSSVALYDRPNLVDRVTAGTLTFSDGTSVAVPALDNTGAGTTISFPARSTTSLRFSVTGVSSTTSSVGLAELQAFAP